MGFGVVEARIDWPHRKAQVEEPDLFHGRTQRQLGDRIDMVSVNDIGFATTV